MTDPLPPLQDPAHTSAWAMAYLDGELSPGDRAAFEAHMKTHDACREHVETMRAAFPALAHVLMEDGPPRTGAEYAEIARAAEAKLKTKQAAESAHPALSPGRGEGVGRDRIPSPPAGERARVRGRRIWAWAGGGFAGLAAAAAAVVVFLDPFTAGLEPELFKAAVVDLAPAAGDGGVEPPWPVPPSPPKLALSAVVRFGRLQLSSPRAPTDVYTAVVLIDSQRHLWVVQPADRRDPTCTADQMLLPSASAHQPAQPASSGCGDLNLRVELDRLPPGAFQVAVLASTFPIFKGDLEDFGKDPTGAEAGRMGLRAYGSVVVER